MAVPELPAIRVAVFVTRVLLQKAILLYVQRLQENPGGGPVVIFEGGDFNLLKASMVFTRTGEDVAVIGMHFAPIRAGVIAGGPADDDEMDTVKGLLDDVWSGIRGFYPPEFRYDRVVFHDAGPKITGTDGKTIHDPGEPKGTWNPALRTDVLAGTGQLGDSETEKLLPEQVAATVTFKTVARKQWGRVYLPAGDANMIADTQAHAEGARQFDATTTDAIRSTFGDLLDAAAAADIPLVVWSHVHQHALSVETVQVDSIPDVIRKRRDDRPFRYTTHSLPS